MPKILRASSLALALVLTPLCSQAADAASDIDVVAPYARAVSPVEPNSAAYMTLKNAGATERSLIGASSPAASAVELHTHIHDGDVMRMRQVESIAIPADGTTELKPGGSHLMLLGLEQPLMPGDQIDLTLEFADGSTKALHIPVREIGGGR